MGVDAHGAFGGVFLHGFTLPVKNQAKNSWRLHFYFQCGHYLNRVKEWQLKCVPEYNMKVQQNKWTTPLVLLPRKKGGHPPPFLRGYRFTSAIC